MFEVRHALQNNIAKRYIISIRLTKSYQYCISIVHQCLIAIDTGSTSGLISDVTCLIREVIKVYSSANQVDMRFASAIFLTMKEE